MIILLFSVGLATMLNIFLKKYDIPTVIGYVFTGVAVAGLFNLGQDGQEALSHLAEFGIVFLMFTIGLEFSFRHLKKMKKEVFLIGGMQMVVSGIILYLAGHYLFGFEVKTAIIVGLALSLSSTAIVLKMLNENNDIHSGYGKFSLGILLFQDLAAIPILLMISFFTSSDKSAGAMILNTVGGAAIIFAGLFIFGKYFAERFFSIVTRTRSEEIFLVSVLLVVIAFSVLAESVGFTYSLGAFLAGMLLSETKYRYRLESDLVPFRDILLGVFFVSIGMMMDIHILIESFWYVAGITFMVMATKGIILYLTVSRFSERRTSIKTALALMQVGEFALAIFAIAASKGLLDEKTTQILIAGVVFSMIITPFVIKNIRKIADIFTEEPEPSIDTPVVSGTFHEHIIICGYGPVGQMVAKQAKEKDQLYIVLEHDGNIVENGIESGEPIFLANAGRRATLEHFNIQGAKSIIVAIENETQRRLICENIISFPGNISSTLKVNNKDEAEIYREMGITHVVNGRELVATALGKAMGP